MMEWTFCTTHHRTIADGDCPFCGGDAHMIQIVPKSELDAAKARAERYREAPGRLAHAGADGNSNDGCIWCLNMGGSRTVSFADIKAGKHHHDCPIGRALAATGDEDGGDRG